MPLPDVVLDEVPAWRALDAPVRERTLRWLSSPDHHLVVRGCAGYPALLDEIARPPELLYAVGRIELLNAPAIAVVGSRNATPQGMQDARALAAALSGEGFTIVSGLALGIDAAAHRGGLAGGASTVAVLGTGADVLYPRRNLALAREIAASGCVLTDFPLGTPPLPGNFPSRNRLISGLSRGVLVVEAAPESGSLITARCALEQNREVFAIPGSIHSPLSRGCNGLIQQGAMLVQDAGDVLSQLGHAVRAAAGRKAREAPPADALLDAMGFAPVSVDQMAQHCGLGVAALCARLSRLELEGRVSALPGGWFQRIAQARGGRDIE